MTLHFKALFDEQQDAVRFYHLVIRQKKLLPPSVRSKQENLHASLNEFSANYM